jgi:DNA helicase-2/ATP-dependent DNA helicase PcrA
VLAGAGSGKTRVITHRIAWLILEQHVGPEEILAVTFTNKAAGEMRERVARLVPGVGFRAHIGTFHGLAARILRKWGRAVGMNPSFVIYDDDDWTRLLQRIVVDDLNLEKDTTRGIARLIDSWQSEGLLPADVPKAHDLLFEWALKAYEISRKKLDDSAAIDFGGLLLKLRELLRADAGKYVKEGVRHVLVDEYQDVNAVQAEIVLAFGRAADSIAVVGDDDQAIYGWRGASASNLKKFLTAMPGAKLVKLEENYRSTSMILAAANGIISRNVVRLGKTLRVAAARDAEPGRRVRVMRTRDDLEEARRVVSDILDHARAGTSLDDVAVLYRTNALSRPFEDELRRTHLPYRVVGGVRFYDRKEVKDVLATLRCAINPQSDVDTLRFLAAVPRGIGDTTLKKLDGAARARGLSLLRAMNDPGALADASLSDKAKKRSLEVSARVLAFGDRVARGQDGGSASAVGAKEAIAMAVKESGLLDRLEAEGGIEAEGRLENLGQLMNAAELWAEQARAVGQPDDVVGFLESASLMSSVDESKLSDGRGLVTLMSLHSAKGLEFEVVYLAGLEEHGIPHARALQDGSADELEEERRLAYVGITRAKRRLVLSHADVRMVNGQRKMRAPSRFLREVPRDVLEGDIPQQTLARADTSSGPRVVYDDVEDRPRGLTRLVMTDAGSLPGGEDATRVERDEPSPIARRLLALEARARGTDPRPWGARATPVPAARGHRASEGETALFPEGARVWHRHFGTGTVVGVRGRGHGQAALVRFDGERQHRVIIARHLKGEHVAGT